MENAGCSHVPRGGAAADPATAPLAVQKRVAEVITHELAHQWFGNLVTMVWWDDLWLNEAFATWMAYKIVDAWRPEWRIWMDFEAGKGAALALDALRVHAPDPRRGRTTPRRPANLRRHHLRKGRRRAAHDRGLPRRGPLPRRHPSVHATPPGGERDRGRSVERAGRGVGAADHRDGERLDPAGGLSADRPGAGSGSGSGGDGDVDLRQRRFFADPDAPAAAPHAAGTRWMVPMVLRFRDAKGIKEQPVLFRAELGDRAAGGGRRRGVVHRQRGVARVLPDGVRRRDAGATAWRGRRAAAGRAHRAASPTSGRWCGRGWRRSNASATWWSACASEEDHVVLDEVVSRLALIEHRFLADGDRALFGAFVARALRRARAGARMGAAARRGRRDAAATGGARARARAHRA